MVHNPLPIQSISPLHFLTFFKKLLFDLTFHMLSHTCNFFQFYVHLNFLISFVNNYLYCSHTQYLLICLAHPKSIQDHTLFMFLFSQIDSFKPFLCFVLLKLNWCWGTKVALNTTFFFPLNDLLWLIYWLTSITNSPLAFSNGINDKVIPILITYYKILNHISWLFTTKQKGKELQNEY